MSPDDCKMYELHLYKVRAFIADNKNLGHAESLFDWKNSIALKRSTYGQEQKN
jgi:hypothetical protein